MALYIHLTCESPRLYTAYLDGVYNAVGSLELSDDLTFVEMVHVSHHHQRQGIATALYDFVEADLGYTLKPSQWLTRDGAAFRSSRDKTTINSTMNRASTSSS